MCTLCVCVLITDLNQKSMAEEMKETIMQLVDSRRLVLRGLSPLSQGESKLIRRSLAQRLGLDANKFDGVQDDIRFLQRKVVVQLHDEAAKKEFKENASATPGGPAGAGLMGVAPRIAPTANQADPLSDLSSMREILMEMQGLGMPKEDEGEALMRIRKAQKKMSMQAKPGRDIDDDYLCGPMSVDTYMCYRVRPVIMRYQKKANKLAWRLSTIEMIVFTVQASGSVLAIFFYNEWVALTVALSAVLQSFIEFMKLRDQVTSINLALRDLQALMVFWDSLSIVRRRTPAVKMQVVATTEGAILLVTNNQTTAASNTITSVAKQLAQNKAEEDAAGQEE